MDDLIKRQDAITAYCEHECGIKGMTRENCGATDCGTIFDDIPSAQQWIPCSERLPDGRLNKSYLVQDKDGRRAVGTYTNWGWVFGHYMNDPVAWMPLPEPYKGEKL